MSLVRLQSSIGSFGFSQIAGAFSARQASAVEALLASLADGFGLSELAGLALGGMGTAQLGLLSAPLAYGPGAAKNGLDLLGDSDSFSGLPGFGGFSFDFNATLANLNLSSSRVIPTKPSDTPVDDVDKFAVHQQCVSNVVGNPSNLNNGDHIALAIHDILQKSDTVRDGTSFKALPPAELQKKLKEEYGIDSEVTKVKDKEGKEIDALKFANGSVFADGAGDGKLDTGDYNFGGKIKEIEKKYGASADELVQGMKDQKAQIDAMYPGASKNYDLSATLGNGLQATGERVKYEKELKAFTAEAKSKYGVELDPYSARELLAQKKLAEQYGIKLDDETLRAQAQQAAFFNNPQVQMLLRALAMYSMGGNDVYSIFRTGLGLSLYH